MAVSTHTEVLNSDETQHAEHGAAAYFKLLPRWLLAAFALVFVLGVILVGGKAHFDENAAFDAMSNCGARLFEKVIRDERYSNYLNLIRDGTHDGFGNIHVNAQRDGVSRVVSICDVDPATGLRLFRRALDNGNVSAKLVALYCANFLARSQNRPAPESVKGVLEAEDFARILTKLDPVKEADEEVRLVALKAMSDLVVLLQTTAKERYEKLPADSAVPVAAATDAAKKSDEPKESEDLFKSIKTHEEKLDGKAVLLIRWTSPGLARAWWKEQAAGGAWDKERQRFVIP